MSGRYAELERAAIEKIRQMLAPATGDEVYELFLEYEAAETLAVAVWTTISDSAPSLARPADSAAASPQ